MWKVASTHEVLVVCYPYSSPYPEGERRQAHTLVPRRFKHSPFSGFSSCPGSSRPSSSKNTEALSWTLGVSQASFPSPRRPVEKRQGCKPFSLTELLRFAISSRRISIPKWKGKMIQPTPRKWPVLTTSNRQTALPLRQNRKKSVSFGTISKACFVIPQNAFLTL